MRHPTILKKKEASPFEESQLRAGIKLAWIMPSEREEKDT